MKKRNSTRIRKIFTICISLLILMLSMTSCAIDSGKVFDFVFLGVPMDWQEVDLGDYGSARMPKDWNISTVDGFMYISSDKTEESGCILVQTSGNSGGNAYFSRIESREWMRDIHFSNGSSVTKYEIYYEDGTLGEMFCVEFYGAPDFYCVDNSISEKTLEKIAQSFTPCD